MKTIKILGIIGAIICSIGLVLGLVFYIVTKQYAQGIVFLIVTILAQACSIWINLICVEKEHINEINEKIIILDKKLNKLENGV